MLNAAGKCYYILIIIINSSINYKSSHLELIHSLLNTYNKKFLHFSIFMRKVKIDIRRSHLALRTI